MQISQQVKEDTELKEKYQNSLIEEIQQLKNEIQRLKQDMSNQRQQCI